EELLAMLHRLAIAQAVPDAIDNSRGDQQRLQELAAMLTAEDVQLFYQMGLNGRRDLPLAPDPRSGLEMALLRMLAFRPQGAPQTPGSGRASPPHHEPPAIPAEKKADVPVAATTEYRAARQGSVAIAP